VIRVLVVDDSAFVRKALSRMLSSADDVEVVGTAIDGQDGVEKVLALRPDVVTLDVKMPRLDGLEALRRIMAECPTPVLLLSSLTGEGADITLRGLDLGALDFVDKSSVEGHMNLLALADELIEKVRGLAKAHQRTPVPVPSSQLPLPEFARQRAELVVIGTSTGPRCRRTWRCRCWSYSTCRSASRARSRSVSTRRAASWCARPATASCWCRAGC
jgi:two-component system, chemotaxis family, protein-glutamate methylesterase/glutaminase